VNRVKPRRHTYFEGTTTTLVTILEEVFNTEVSPALTIPILHNETIGNTSVIRLRYIGYK